MEYLPFCFLIAFTIDGFQLNIQFYENTLHVFSLLCLMGSIFLYFYFEKIPKNLLSIFKDYSVDNELMECFIFLNERLNNNDLLFCIPSRGHIVNGAGYFTENRILDGAGKSPESHEFGVKELYAFDMTNENFVKILSKYNFKYLILQKNTLTQTF